MHRRTAGLSAALAIVVALANCSGSSPSGPTPPGGGDNNPPIATTATIYAAGDIAGGAFGALETGKLLDRLPGALILALGDLAYMNGTAANFRDCYDPAWGRHIERTRPVPGNTIQNHPVTPAIISGELAGPRGLGYYAFDAGPPHHASTARFLTKPVRPRSPGSNELKITCAQLHPGLLAPPPVHVGPQWG